MRIHLLGTGTPTPSLKRMSSSYLVRVGKAVMLFDQGPGAVHRLLELGLQPTDVTHLFLTHLHYDHCSDYVRLLLNRWDQGANRLPELQVFGPPGTARFNDLLFSREGAFGPDLLARTENEISVDVFRARGGQGVRPWPAPVVTEVKHGDVVQGEGWTLRAGTAVHAQPQLQCLGYRLESAEGVFAYSGDTGPCASMKDLAQGADVLVHMCHYISGTELSKSFARACTGHLELADLGQAAAVKNLVISHVTEQMDVPGVRERLLREMAERYRGNLIWGEDLMEVPVADPLPDALK